MGEYAKYNGQEIKIGTCQDMYYLRASQANMVQPMRGNVDPVSQAELIRFRFPFPQEDGTEPGAYSDFNCTFGVSGVEVPEGVEHHNLQFARSYPAQGGVLLSVPCPESQAGKQSGLKYHYNGYSGKVQIAQQRLVDGKLVLICQCGSCGAAYRCSTLEDAQPVIDSLNNTAASMDREAQLLSNREGKPVKSSGDFYREMAQRIVDGYTKPNAWTK